jgi:UDP-glucose 4-epimerase
MPNPTILLTGATGFLGSHMLEALVVNDYKVIALKRSTSDMWRISNIKGHVTFYDVDQITMNDVFCNHKIDVIVHMATLYKKYAEPSDIHEMVDANITFPLELLAQAVKHGVKGFVNTGTFFEYDCSKQPVDEDAAVKAFNFYAKTKLAFEATLKTYADDLCINTFKLFSPFGEKDNPKLLPLIIKKSLTNQTITLSEGLQKLDFIYAKDIVSAYLKGIERMDKASYQAEYEVFNLGSGSPLSVRDIVSIVEESIGYRVEVLWGPPSEMDIQIAYANIDKAKRLLNWTPDNGVRAGIINCMKYYRNVEDI